jgi:hypothetical protein
MSKLNKPGGDLLNYLFVRGHNMPIGLENVYFRQSGMDSQAYRIPRFCQSWASSIALSSRCEGDDICDDIALLLNEVLSKEENKT